MKWEYLVETIKLTPGNGCDHRLSVLGNQRWELVSTLNKGVDNVTCVFKRELVDKPDPLKKENK